MCNRQIVTVAAAAVMAAAGVWAMAMAGAADREATQLRRLEIYPMKSVDAQTAAESLNRLLGGREDVRITADTKKNFLLILADGKDQATLRAFLALVTRSDKGSRVDLEPPPRLMFPEEVERAMMGEAHEMQRMLPPESKPEAKWDVPKRYKP